MNKQVLLHALELCERDIDFIAGCTLTDRPDLPISPSTSWQMDFSLVKKAIAAAKAEVAEKPSDAELIAIHGGPTALAKKLGRDGEFTAQRVSNWIKRGIPASIKLKHPSLFLKGFFQSEPESCDAAAPRLAPRSCLDEPSAAP